MPIGTFKEFVSFIMNKMLVGMLLLVLALVNAIVYLPREVSIPLPIVIFFAGSYVLFKRFRREKSLKFANKLRVLMEEFREKIIHGGYGYSIVNIAYRIAGDKTIIQDKTSAWSILFSSIWKNLTKKSDEVYDRVTKYAQRGNGTDFNSIFEDFRTVLSLLQDFKSNLYNMINETKQIKNFGQDPDFQKIYKRFKEEFDNYIDRLVNYSDDIKAELQLSLSKDLLEKVADLNELYG